MIEYDDLDWVPARSPSNTLLPVLWCLAAGICALAAGFLAGWCVYGSPS